MTLSRAGTWIVALIIGFVFGVAGTVSQPAFWGWFPIGLVLALVGAGAITLAVRLLTQDRWAALATGIGVMIATLLFSGSGPGGSVIVPAPPEGELSTGLIWTLAVPVIVAVIIAWPSGVRPVARADGSATAPAQGDELDSKA